MADRSTARRDPDSPRGWTRYLPLAAIGVAALLGAFFLRDWLSFETLADNREALIAFRDANYALTVAVFVAAYVAIVAFSLPGAAIATLTGGFLFGLFPGVLYNTVAATIGATAIFLAARHGLGDRLAARMDASEGMVKRIREGIRENETSYLFVMRLIPAVPFFVANLIPAFVGVGLGKYVVTTFLGILPGSVVYTWVGAGLGEVFARGERPDFDIIFEPHILGPILGLAALALLPIVIKRIRGKA
ncbi:SNARE associated Golgi protein [Jannaschia seosinensis]|uniref:TVP38/TMEM64 family membrane protein n=1 Tax=Jannaschia seosinensis TaxID=313367 RepID=A0A0M7BDF9_9RHOB|nr:VTT domain-containing protein [Jannaschia seosinensis]CUH40770.1 SNARE associated Golgi protein [Jannaschia seosinensis]